MAIVPLNKISLIGLAEESELWLEPLQRLGLMHVEMHRATSHIQDPDIGLPEKGQQALRYLLECKYKVKTSRADQIQDVNYIIEEILENKRRCRELEDLRDDYLQFIKMRHEWGDFHLPPVESLGGYYLWFYKIPKSRLHKLDDCAHPWEIVGERQGYSYVIVISQHEPTKIDVPFQRVRSGYKSLSRLQNELDQVERDLDDLQLARASLTRWRNLLAAHLNHLIDSAEISKAKCQLIVSEEICYLQGWAPVDAVAGIHDFARRHGLICLQQPVEQEQPPPTLLQGNPWFNGAKAVVQFFQTPAYHTWDPSAVVFVSFNLFFAMILSDAGYAALCGLLVLLYRHRLRAKSLGVYRLAQSVCVSALLWGVLVGSYFGVSPPPGSMVAALDVVDINNFDAMINLSIAIGVIHLLVATLSAGAAQANRWLLLGNLGWAIIFVSGFAWYRWNMGQATLALGMLLVFCFSSDRQVRGGKSLLFRVLDGLKALTGFSKGFGDVLSYMRLFALGLSSSQLAITFNNIAMEVRAEMPGIGLLFAFLILLFGHLLNLALGVMGGVIHGLRLNLIEFLNWGIKAEGYPFKPFAKQEDQRWKQ